MENTNNIPTAYEGKEPYIFVSYAHKDSEKVVPVVQALKNAGFRVWYDEGLVQGENYHEDIAEHIALCTTALVFLSSNSANSTYCKMEIEYAFSCGKKLSVVYLEENVALSPGIQLLLNSIQSLMYGDYESKEDFMQALFQTPCLQMCAEKNSLYFSPDEKSTAKKKIVVSPLHEHRYTSESVAATCIARGYTVHKCACGYEYKDSYTSLAGHKYALALTKEPTCTELGCTKEVCTVCGEKKVTEISAKGHSFGKWIEKLSPTCTLAGKKVRQCSECGYIEEETLASKGHQWSPAEQRIDEHGNKEYVSFCKLCGEEKVSKETEEQRKKRVAQLQAVQKIRNFAILSGLIGIFFFILMVIGFVEEAIGSGIISLLFVFVSGGACIPLTKAYIESKPPLSEEEKFERKKKLAILKKIAITAASVVAVVMILILVITYIIIPNGKYNNAVALMNDSKYEDAISAFESLEGYGDSDTQIKQCKYLSAVVAQKSQDYDVAYAIFTELDKYSDSSSKASSCAVEAAEYAMAKEQYDVAVAWYEKAGETSEVNNAKYQYVMAHQNNTDKLTYVYLFALKQISYKDASTVYDQLYEIHLEYVINDSRTDFTTHKTSFKYVSSYDGGAIFIHVKITGGYPGQEVYVDVDGWHYDTAFVKCNGEWFTLTDDMLLLWGRDSTDTTITIKVYGTTISEECTITVYK